jgi:xanthosine utilization system XapX-like protein
MQTRLLACLAGGLLGIVVALLINQSLGLNPIVAAVGCALLGMGLGYVVSIFFDIFTAGAGDESAQSE